MCHGPEENNMWIKASVFAVTSIFMMSLSEADTSSDVQAARALVSGTMDRLSEFQQNLIKHVGSNFDKAAIKCDGCADLGPTASHTKSGTVTYTFFRDNKRLTAFIKSWGELQTTKVDNVTIKFDIDYVVSDCSTQPQPCVGAPYCNLTKGCDQVKGPPCTKCQ
jgi:hypothetical protein